jgi:hypothetical protein
MASLDNPVTGKSSVHDDKQQSQHAEDAQELTLIAKPVSVIVNHLLSLKGNAAKGRL